MTFEEVLPALKTGKKITRKNDNQFVYYMVGDGVNYIDTEIAPDEAGVENSFLIADILADDWEVCDD